ncbi:MAG: PhnD/SsuA/transferrin family substrate-binding protein [Propionibacteriales bacterium]|nr:PhnD/SsuA/transferrin family substrate-binding protein [Propionibacteriales bacterium]
MGLDPYCLGAVVYHPKVESIWEQFGGWFAEQDFPLAVSYFDDYERQVDALVEGGIDTAWNTNLAYVCALERTNGALHALAMRDTDLGWTSKIVVRTDSAAETLEDLRGKRVGFGDADSPQAHILPVHALRAQGFDPAVEFLASRMDRDLGKHGDTGGAELAQLARVRAGELEGSVASSVTLDAVERLGDNADLRVVWTSPEFPHCNFSVLDSSQADHDRFKELLLAMDASDPKLCEPMELEYVNQWIEAQEHGYGDLIAAVKAGPIVVGDVEVAA